MFGGILKRYKIVLICLAILLISVILVKVVLIDIVYVGKQFEKAQNCNTMGGED
jgi:uncharacterized membrane protein affecting hemolysin expression